MVNGHWRMDNLKSNPAHRRPSAIGGLRFKLLKNPVGDDPYGRVMVITLEVSPPLADGLI